MSNDTSPLVRLYHTLQEQLHHALDEGREHLPTLQQLIDESKEKSAELSELTREEVEVVSNYLQRDLEAAGNYLAETGEDLERWLQMEETLVEDRIKELFRKMADPTRIALDQLNASAQADHTYQQGEIIGFGRLRCTKCDNTLEFTQASVIPVCPECGNDKYRQTV